jgi:hypothetical protein
MVNDQKSVKDEPALRKESVPLNIMWKGTGPEEAGEEAVGANARYHFRPL